MRNLLGKIIVKIRELTKRQRIILGVLGATLLMIVCLAIGIACFPMNSEPIEVEQTEEKPEVIVEEIQTTAPQEENKEPRKISFSGTSIEKDLKIKIVDEADALVTGTAFKVTVTAQKKTQGKEYTDEDTDGIIHITDMTAGKYIVQLHSEEGFIIVENDILMTVKGKIEYKKVDVKNEIKKESEVDIKKEEAPTQKPKEESKLKDTVKLLESKKEDVVVTKEKVDFSNFPQASASENKRQETILNTTYVEVPEYIALYSDGGEQSKIFRLNLSVSGDKQIIQRYSWKNDNESVFAFTENEDNSVTITAVQTGSANLGLLVDYEDAVAGMRGQKEINIAITVSEVTDDKTPLKDKEGTLLYLDTDKKEPAKVKDYGLYNEFYTTKYTGWQTIDGKLYYFDEKHNSVKGIQVIGGGRYTFGEDGVLLKSQEQRGIDVSKWNGNIDWNAVANAGIDFAIIRAGNRGTSTGALIEDSYFKKNIEGATKAGIKVGVYIYSQAITEAEAVEEASMAISLVAGYKLHLPIYFDTEEYRDGRANKLSVAQRTTIAKAFCETVRNAGYMPGIYSNYYWLRDNLNMSQLEMYSVWVAHYATSCGYPGRYDMWQYTSSGSVPGIKGKVDLNISYVAY